MSVDSSQAVEELPKDFMAHPFEILERLRAAGPAHPVIFPHGAKVWLVTRYDEVRQLLSDPRVSKDGSRANYLFARHSGMITDEEESGSIGVNDELTMHMVNSDPPRHTRLRSLANQGLTPRKMEASRPRLEQVADELLDALDDGRPVVDLLAGFTQPMTITTICEVLGVPAQDKPLFHQWAAQLIGAGHDPEVVEAASNSVIAYARKSIEDKRANPGPDMLSMLVHGKADGGDQLTFEELVSMFFLIIMAGHVTSMHTLTNTIHSLLTHPDELAKLRADMSLLPTAIDELIRFDPGIAVGTFRFSKEDIDLGEVTIPAGEILALSLASANRDSTKYPDPDRLDLDRCPKNHLSFGHGIHYCIGAPLARIQLEVALTKLLTRFPDLELAAAAESLEWENGALMRGLVTLPVALHGRAAD